MQYKNKTLNKVKIIGGKYKNKIINFDYIDNLEKTSSLRPTSNRARETLFNWLMHDIHDAYCLDLFAGSGALSFEALSRGAKKITLIENSINIYKNLLKTKKDFTSEQSKINIINTNSLDFIRKNNQDNLDNIYNNIIFIDPPYDIINKDFIIDLINNLKTNNFINNNTLLYLESDKELTNLFPDYIKIIKNKKISSVYIYLCSTE